MTQTDLQALYEHPKRQEASILSIYLNVDQAASSNQNRGFKRQLENLVAAVRSGIAEAAEGERCAAAAHRIREFVSAYEPTTARGLVLFADGLDGFFWQHELRVPIHNHVRWGRELLLQPLANILDQFEKYSVVLVDRTRLRLFTVFLEDIEETAVGEGTGRAKDLNAHLRQLVRSIDEFVSNKPTSRLVLGGESEVATALRDRLPRRLAARVIGTTNISIGAAIKDVLSATAPVNREYESRSEADTVREVLRSDPRKQKTVTGLGRTLKAVNADRVWELIYSEGLISSGFECTQCGALFSQPRKSCLYCRGTVEQVGNVVERAVDHAFQKGAKIEVVTGEASASLSNVGGIAAFLKAKSASVRPWSS
jgi:peptide chain release factor subunit 1